MENLKITKGEVILNESKCQLLSSNETFKNGGIDLIAQFYTGFDMIATKEECLSNAKLCYEAFNVTNETGKTPRQLADINKELLEALEELVNANPLRDGHHQKRLNALVVIKKAKS